MTDRNPHDPADQIFWLCQITAHPERSPEARLVFHLSDDDEARVPLPLGSVLHILDRLIIAGRVPSWLDRGEWRRRAGHLPRCGEQMLPEHEVMLEAILTNKRCKASKIDFLVNLELLENRGPDQDPLTRSALVPVGVFLQCLCAAACLGAVPPLEGTWVQVAIPGWLTESVKNLEVHNEL